MGLGHTSDLILSPGNTGEATRITASRLWPKPSSLALVANISYTCIYHIQALLLSTIFAIAITAHLMIATFSKLFQNAFLTKVSIDDHVKLRKAEAVW